MSVRQMAGGGPSGLPFFADSPFRLAWSTQPSLSCLPSRTAQSVLPLNCLCHFELPLAWVLVPSTLPRLSRP
ncbi:MAG TPA: hypothetical protein VFX23_10825 [Limnobacter sp.]|nr:hypothetical protein [Limnobacter sp.]